jgi:hypothetical protein
LAFYAWAPIRYGVEQDEKGVITKVLVRGVGKEVSQSELDLSDEDWRYMVTNGIVREQEYPISEETVAAGGTLEAPREVMIREAREMMAQAESLARAAETGTPTGTAAQRSGLQPSTTPATEGL